MRYGVLESNVCVYTRGLCCVWMSWSPPFLCQGNYQREPSIVLRFVQMSTPPHVIKVNSFFYLAVPWKNTPCQRAWSSLLETRTPTSVRKAAMEESYEHLGEKCPGAPQSRNPNNYKSDSQNCPIVYLPKCSVIKPASIKSDKWIDRFSYILNLF